MNSFLGAHCPVKLRIASIKKRQNCADAIVDYRLPLRRLAQVTPGSQKPVTEVNHGALRALQKPLGVLLIYPNPYYDPLYSNYSCAQPQ